MYSLHEKGLIPPIFFGKAFAKRGEGNFVIIEKIVKKEYIGL